MNNPKIIFENKDFTIVYKPHGLNADQDKQGNPSLESWLKDYYKKYIYLIHRLDRPVSGLLLVTKKKSVLQFMQENWKHFQKKYWALVEGEIQPNQMELKHYHFKDFMNFKALISSEPKEGYQLCSLQYQIIKENQKNSLLEIELITGKYHQIRAQLAYIGHPIVGDTFYGSSFHFNGEIPKIALTACKLNFYYPDATTTFQFEFYPEEEFWKI